LHPKDGIWEDEKSEVIYKIPCRNCEHVDIGETERWLAARMKE